MSPFRQLNYLNFLVTIIILGLLCEIKNTRNVKSKSNRKNWEPSWSRINTIFPNKHSKKGIYNLKGL